MADDTAEAIAALQARIEQLEAERSQTARVAPEALAAANQAPRMPCVVCGVVHGPKPDDCGVCRKCRRPKGGQEYFAATLDAPTCPDCGSHPITPDQLLARGHLPSAIAALRTRLK